MARSACASAASAICRRFWADGAATAAPVQAPAACPLRPTPCPRASPGGLHHLSLKDNSVIDKLDQLQAIGVASAKIEGRLRTPEYVAAAVSACLAGREGRAYDRDLLKNAFSRSGFTSGYLDGKIDGTMFGVRSEADAELTKKTLPALRELYRRERSRVPVRMKLEIEEGGEKLTVTDADGNKAFAYGDFEPQPARADPTESLKRSLAKTGGTPFAAENIEVEMDEGPWFVPGSTVNELRRERAGRPAQEARGCCAPGRRRMWSWRRCPSAPCRPTGPSVPGSSAGIRCRNRLFPASEASHPAHRAGRPCPPRVAGQDASWSCPGSCSARWKRTPPAASRPPRMQALRAMR